MPELHAPLEDTLRTELSSYDDLIAALLSRRGITTKEEAEKFLNPSYDSHLIDPLLIKNMEKAAKRLAQAMMSGERITVWSDYDCDGIPGAVVMHDFLQKAGADFDNYIPHRHNEGYGVNVSGIEKLAKQGTKLVVTVDSGITDVEAVARAKELGMDVIVTDHHLPGAALPPAFAVIDPKQTGETSPFRDWCGAGLAWKLACATLAVAPALRERVPEGYEKWFLDMAGLATIADMVPLHGENRIIAKYGLLVMRKSPRLGLQKLCNVARVDQRFITEGDVGFMIAPRINAASRMGEARDAFELFTTTDEAKAEALAKKLEKANRHRKAEAGAITRAVHERLEGRALQSVIALGDPDWRPGLLGLVANGIAEEYGRPVFLWGKEGNNTIKGSCRAGDATNLVRLMEAAVDTFAEFGGHAASGGFSVREDAVFFLEDRLVAAYAQLAEKPAKESALRADAILAPIEATTVLLKKLERLAPFGEANPKPAFLFRNVEIVSAAKFGKGEQHIKLKIVRDESENSFIDAITFFAKGSLKDAAAYVPGTRAHVLAELEKDQFTRGTPVRLRLLDIVLA